MGHKCLTCQIKFKRWLLGFFMLDKVTVLTYVAIVSETGVILTCKILNHTEWKETGKKQTGPGVVITHTLTDVLLHTATSHYSSALIKDSTHQFAWPGQTQTCCPLCCSSTSSVWTGTGTPWCQSWPHLQCRSCDPGTAGRASSGPAYRTVAAAAVAPAAEERLAEISLLMVWYFSGPNGEILPVLDQSLGVRALELQRRGW